MHYDNKHSKEKIVTIIAREYLKKGRKLDHYEVSNIEGIPTQATIKNIFGVKEFKEVWEQVEEKAKEISKKVKRKPVCGCKGALEGYNYVTYKTKWIYDTKTKGMNEVIDSREDLKEEFIFKCPKCKNVYKTLSDEHGIYRGDIIR